MSNAVATRIITIQSKDIAKIMTFINLLPFKVEIKWGYYGQKKHHVGFVPPDDLTQKEVIKKFKNSTINLDIGG